ncbi:unnamed protein product, partial [Notodromas monacha]
NHSPSPPPPPPPIMDEEGNDTSITGLVDRVLSPLTNHAQETRNSIINNDEHRSRAGSWQNNVVRANGNVGYGELNGDLEVPDHQEGRKKRMTSKTYFIVKELLMTERTYRKDLEVIEVWLRDELMSNDDETLDDGIPRHVLDSLFEIHEPIFDFHSLLLKDIEERFRTWDSTSGRHPHHHNHTRLASSGGSRIGDVFHNSMHKMTPLYVNYLNGHRDVMEGLEYALKDSITFDQIIRDFEATEVCYLPLFTFVLKPLHRLTHYQALLRRLVDHYPIDHPDLTSCKAALTLMTDLVARVGEVLPTSDNYAKLVELQRELKGFDALIQPERHFIREGSLQKLSRKGYQQRMFFLFSDVLLYAARVTQPRLHFKIHGVIPLRDVMVEEADRRSTASHSFTIYANNRALLVAASTADEKRNWLQDFSRAIADAREKPETSLQYLSLKSASSSEDVGGGDANNAGDRGNGAPAVNQRSNTSVHVCWHRNTSVSSLDLRLAANSQLSGYLLRKFKSSSGWQKLWVVFTNFCLFFYKTDEDPFPLASLPLLSYRVTTPSPQDEIAKEHVFKLQFKNHVYFFRAESEYTFNRWMDVIGNATNRNFDVTSELLRSSPM